MTLSLKSVAITESRIDLPWLIGKLHYADTKAELVQPDADIAFEFTPDCIQSQRLAR